MRKCNFLNKTTVRLFAISMCIFLFAGCQSNNNKQAASNNTQNRSTWNSNRPSTEQMKKRIQDGVQSLVTAGTITQNQADKIVTAYTTRPTGNGQNKAQDNKKDNQQGNNGQNRRRNNPLSELVSDGIITQAQADAVVQKMRGNSTYKNNGQGSQNSNGQLPSAN